MKTIDIRLVFDDIAKEVNKLLEVNREFMEDKKCPKQLKPIKKLLKDIDKTINRKGELK